MVPPIDFAIITALRVEREAVVRRLEGVSVVQFDDEPLTFYAGEVRIPGEDVPYSVVLAQLIEVGNNDAGIAATRIIQRWKPRNVLMVGIAGGVRGKVRLGDVVVSQFAYYYEPSKLIDGVVEHRGRQFNSDLMLYGRAGHYEAAEWKADVQVARPDAADGGQVLPEVHFAPIGCGEKVVADLEELASILRQCPKALGIAMEGAGVAKAALSDAFPPRYLEVRGISDFAGPEKNDGWHEYAADAAAAFVIGLLRSRPFAPGPSPEHDFRPRQVIPTLVVTAQSLRVIPADEFLPALDDDAKQGELERLVLDFADLVQNKTLQDPETAAKRLADPQGALLAALARRADARIVFHGLASIPPVVLAGHLVTDRRRVRLYDFHPTEMSWEWPAPGGEIPPLACKGMPNREIKKVGDAVVRVSLSYQVQPNHTAGLGIDAAVNIDLSVPLPSRNIIRSEDQTRQYGRVFREALDVLSRRMPRCHRVHLFYAGPMALAFHIGQQISENIHPAVVVWNYSRGYDWAIDFAKAVAGEPCVVRPPAPPQKEDQP